MNRDNVAIAKKAARTRAAMKSSRMTDRAAYDKARRDESIRQQVRTLIEDKAGYTSTEHQSAMHQSAIAADHLRAGAPLRKNRPARRTA